MKRSHRVLVFFTVITAALPAMAQTAVPGAPPTFFAPPPPAPVGAGGSFASPGAGAGSTFVPGTVQPSAGALPSLNPLGFVTVPNAGSGFAPTAPSFVGATPTATGGGPTAVPGASTSTVTSNGTTITGSGTVVNGTGTTGTTGTTVTPSPGFGYYIDPSVWANPQLQAPNLTVPPGDGDNALDSEGRLRVPQYNPPTGGGPQPELRFDPRSVPGGRAAIPTSVAQDPRAIAGGRAAMTPSNITGGTERLSVAGGRASLAGRPNIVMPPQVAAQPGTDARTAEREEEVGTERDRTDTTETGGAEGEVDRSAAGGTATQQGTQPRGTQGPTQRTQRPGAQRPAQQPAPQPAAPAGTRIIIDRGE